MMRRLGVLVAAIALVALGATPALANDASFEVTVDTATLNAFNTILTVTGTYDCDGTWDPEFSGFGGDAFQSQKGGKIVVSAGFGVDSNDLVCNVEGGTEFTAEFWAFAENGETPANWKRGRVLLNFGGSISDGGENGAEGRFIGTVKITK